MRFYSDAIEVEHLRNAMRKWKRQEGEADARRPSINELADGTHDVAMTQLEALVNALAWYDSVLVRKTSTFQRKCHGSCVSAKSSVASCVCQCGGLYHRQGIHAGVVLDGAGEIEHGPVFMEWQVQKGLSFDPNLPDRVERG